MLANVHMLQTQKQFEAGLTLIERFIWPVDQAIDSETKSFFVFKAYPKELKRKQIEQWALLQTKSLSPFVGGHYYQFLSKAGLHLWFSQQPFHGLPETAMQANQSNSIQQVSSIKYNYQQTWHEGLLVSCFAQERADVDNQLAAFPLEINKRAPWAVTRKIDKQLRKPSTWLGLTLFVFLCVLVWQTTAYFSLKIQNYNAQQRTTELQDSLGEQLSIQSQLQKQQQGLLSLQNWHREFAFLPETLAKVAEKINLQGEWQANTITWQNRTLVIELISKKLDIAILVTELEGADTLSNINIRPHVSDNTWVLEASIK
jgi:hypothetical protein